MRQLSKLCHDKWLQIGIVLFLITFCSVSTSWAVSDTIVAVVGNDAITLKDLREYVENIYAQLKLEGKTPKEIEEIMRKYEINGVNQLIEDRLILAMAEEQGIQARREIIDKRLDEIKKNYPSEQDFLDTLNKSGLTVTDLRSKIGDQLVARVVVDKEVKSKIFVNPQEVTQYYNGHVNDFMQNARVNLDSIFVSFEQGKEAARKKAAEARELLAQGKDFLETAKQYSESPSIGIVEKGQMLPDVENKIFALPIGKISPLIEVENGIYIFRVTASAPAQTLTLQEAKEKIYNKIFQTKFKDRFQQWIEKLKKKTYVEIKP